MASKRFVVMGEPKGKARARVTRFGTYTPEATVMYENLVKVEYRRQCGDYRFDDNLPLKLIVLAEFGMPAGMSKAKRLQVADGTLRPTKRPDWDNIGKIVSDALNKIAYRDDSQVVECTVSKHYSDHPKITVIISELNDKRL